MQLDEQSRQRLLYERAELLAVQSARAMAVFLILPVLYVLASDLPRRSTLCWPLVIGLVALTLVRWFYAPRYPALAHRRPQLAMGLFALGMAGQVAFTGSLFHLSIMLDGLSGVALFSIVASVMICSGGLQGLAAEKWLLLLYIVGHLSPVILALLMLDEPGTLTWVMALVVYGLYCLIDGARLRQRFEAGVLDRFMLESAGQAAQAAVAARSAFLANMSHEIRTPMNGVLGSAALLRETSLDDEQMEHLEVIDASGQALMDLIEDILDLSRLEAGQVQLAEDPFSVARVVSGALRVVSPQARAKGIFLESRIDEGVPEWLIGDRKRLGQVLINLMGNAVKFTREGGVRVSARCSEDGITFEVNDTGVGIAEERLEAIFEVFTQADAGITRKFGGTGLGLSISAHLVGAMGGVITVDSTLGVGSTFAFTLSLSSADQPGADQVSGSSLPGISRADLARAALPQGLRILVAEDNRINARVVERLLALAGAEATVVMDGAQAVAEATSADYDVVLMDMQMPVMDGLTATRQIRTALNGSPLPIVALTANALAEHAEQALAAGMNAYVTKPVRPEALYRVIGEVLPTDSGSLPGA